MATSSNAISREQSSNVAISLFGFDEIADIRKMLDDLAYSPINRLALLGLSRCLFWGK